VFRRLYGEQVKRQTSGGCFSQWMKIYLEPSLSQFVMSQLRLVQNCFALSSKLQINVDQWKTGSL
jgi:hypothetical protein